MPQTHAYRECDSPKPGSTSASATHPITKAYHLSYLALRAEYCTDSEQVEALRRSRETVASAVNEFNTRATALLGSAVVPKTAPSTRDDV